MGLARPLGAAKVPRYAKNIDLMKAVRAECLRDYKALFGRSWNPSELEAWASWLHRVHEVDRAALDAVSKLANGLRATNNFYKKHPIQGTHIRRGLRVEHVIRENEVEARLYLDRETLPPEAPAELRAEAANGRPIEVKRLAVAVLSTRYEYLATSTNPNDEAARNGVPSVPIELSCSGTLDMTVIGLRLHSVRRKAEQLLAALPPWPRRVRPAVWESRLAVLAWWDRPYAPDELRERRDKGASEDRLTTSELAAISILSGSVPSLGQKPRTVRSALEVEGHYIDHARKTSASLRGAGVSIPRNFPLSDA